MNPWIIVIFAFMTFRFSPFLYDFFGFISRIAHSKTRFMNLGMLDIPMMNVEDSDQKDVHHIQLYATLLNMVREIKSKRFSTLEVGCGRGGGCYVMEKYFLMDNITGVDRGNSNIKIATGISLQKTTFKIGDANDLKLEMMFDLIVNLESSHAYNSREEFFKRVKKLLNQDGYFAFGDIMRKDREELVEAWLRNAGFTIEVKREISKEVVRSIAKNSALTFPIATKFPFLVPSGLHSFFVTIHSRIFKSLQSGEVVYNLYLLR